MNSPFAAAFIVAMLMRCGHVDAAPLFEDDAVLEIKFSGPFAKLFASSPQRIELPFSLRADGIEHKVGVRLRGNSRLSACGFPPMRLSFPSQTIAGTVFDDQDNLKLVTHCRDHKRAEQDALEEYMAYRIFNLLSSVGFRVRLLRISYADIDDMPDAKGTERFGFVIESLDEVRARLGATATELAGVSRNSLVPDQAALVYIFQYLIGNTDWSIVTAENDDFCCHNGDLIAIDGELYLVPYDFDLSGLVNAHYAKPDPVLRIGRVTQRVYRGYCLEPGALEIALHRIMDKRSEIMEVPASIPGLLPKEIDTASRYLEKFFDQAADQQKLLQYFQSRCL